MGAMNCRGGRPTSLQGGRFEASQWELLGEAFPSWVTWSHACPVSGLEGALGAVAVWESKVSSFLVFNGVWNSPPARRRWPVPVLSRRGPGKVKDADVPPQVTSRQDFTPFVHP